MNTLLHHFFYIGHLALLDQWMNDPPICSIPAYKKHPGAIPFFIRIHNQPLYLPRSKTAAMIN